MRLANQIAVVVCATLVIATPIHAGVMFEAAGAVTNMGNTLTYENVHAIDQSGLASLYFPGVTSFTTFVTTTPTVGGANSFNAWFSQSGSTTGNFDLILGGLKTIDALALWADPQNVGQSINQFKLYASSDLAFSSPTLLGSYTMNDGPGIASESLNVGQIFSFAPITTSYVRIQVLSNHGSTSYTGISEAAFDSVPEPALIGCVGFGALLLSRRRRPAR